MSDQNVRENEEVLEKEMSDQNVRRNEEILEKEMSDQNVRENGEILKKEMSNQNVRENGEISRKEISNQNVRENGEILKKEMSNQNIRENGDIFSKSRLNNAVAEERDVIIIKDSKLGKRTALWLNLGSCFDKLSVALALGSIACSLNLDDNVVKFGKPLAVGSVLTYIGYQVLWNVNPLMTYRVKQGPSLMNTIKGEDLGPTTVLVRQDDCVGVTILKSVVCCAAVLTAFWKDISSFDFNETFSDFKEAAEGQLKTTEQKEEETVKIPFIR